MNLSAFIRSIGHPSYTGTARDPGFVIANILVASLLAVGVDLIVHGSGSVLVVLAVVLLVVRGYAIPGTPAILRAVERRFGATPVGGDQPPRDERELVRAGVLERTTDGFTTTESFLTTWRTLVRAVGPREDDERALAAALGLEPGQVVLRWHCGLLVAEIAGRPLGAWLSRAALVADIVSIAALRQHYPQWRSSSPRLRAAMLSTLTLYLDDCPVCDGSLRLDRAPSRVPGIASRPVTVTCEDCDARLFESGFKSGIVLVDDDTSPSVVGR